MYDGNTEKDLFLRLSHHHTSKHLYTCQPVMGCVSIGRITYF